MAHSTYYCHCDQILDPQNVFHTQSHTQHMYVCMCVCACTCKAHIYVCINLQQHHCKSLQYHTAHKSLWNAAVRRNWFYKTAKTNESHPVTHTHTHTHTQNERTHACARTHTHTHLPAIFFFIIGTKKKCTINMTTTPRPILATKAPHSGILSKYRTETIWKHIKSYLFFVSSAYILIQQCAGAYTVLSFLTNQPK